MSTDLTFITNESGKHQADRFGVLLADATRLFDCLVGYFFISGLHKLHPALTSTEKIRILIGIKTDGATYELIQTAKEQQAFVLESYFLKFQSNGLAQCSKSSSLKSPTAYLLPSAKMPQRTRARWSGR